MRSLLAASYPRVTLDRSTRVSLRLPHTILFGEPMLRVQIIASALVFLVTNCRTGPHPQDALTSEAIANAQVVTSQGSGVAEVFADLRESTRYRGGSSSARERQRDQVSAACQQPQPVAVGVLLTILADAAMGDYYRTALEALRECGDTSAVPVLIEVLSADDWLWRSRAAAALGAIGDPRGIAPLAEALSDRDRNVREAAYEALSEVAEGNLDALAESLTRVDAPAGWQMARLLVQSGEPSVSALLVHADHPDPRVAWRVTWALASLGDPAAFDALVAALRHPRLENRATAAWGLGLLGDSRAVAELSAVVADSEPLVRRWAVDALARLADPTSIEALRTAARDSDPEVRQRAEEALRHLQVTP